MKIAPFLFPPRFLSRTVLALLALVSMVPSLLSQEPSPASADVQRAAMKKLAFLIGRWSGPVTIIRGPSEPLHLTQTENVESKLDGLVLLIEGKSTSADGKVLFNALATVAYDNDAQTYRIRAYNNGHYVDAPLTVPADGFSWGFTAGPAKIENTMHLTGKGEWSEVTQAAFGNNVPQPSVEMLLQRQP